MKVVLAWLYRNWLKVLVAIMLFFATGNHPYVYYQTLRWVVTGVALYSAFSYKQDDKIFLMFLFISIGVLFNPLVPFHMERETWFWIDIIAGILFFAFENEKKHI